MFDSEDFQKIVEQGIDVMLKKGSYELGDMQYDEYNYISDFFST